MNESNLTPAQKRFGSVVSQAWFPPQPDVLARVRSGIASGELLKDRTSLYRELSNDPSLFLLGARELSRRASRAAIKPALSLAPRALIETSSDEELTEIFAAPIDSFARIPYHSGAEISQRRSVQAMVSAVTTDMLEAALGKSDDLGYSCALFRQLGLMLIAWNHPHVYARISASLEPDESLDEALARVLGLSPSALGLHLAREWRVCPTIRASMGDEVPDESPEVRETGKFLRGMCEVGEKLAQLADASVRSTRLKQFDEVRSLVLQRLGPDGLTQIFDRVEAVCRNIREVFPALFAPLPQGQGPARTCNENPFLSKTPRFFQEHLQFVYGRFSKGAAPEELRSVLDQAIRSLGFNRAAIYLLDPVSSVLHPRVALGDLELSSVRAVQIAAPSGSAAEMIARAITTEDLVINGKAMRQVVIRVGGERILGALSLEISRELFDARSEMLGDCVRAVALTISHLIRVS
jgi:hypothetical protein